jgi:hypothetical protein
MVFHSQIDSLVKNVNNIIQLCYLPMQLYILMNRIYTAHLLNLPQMQPITKSQEASGLRQI